MLSLLCSLLVLLLHPSLSSAEPPTAAAMARPGQPETGGDAASVRRIARFRSRGTCQGTRVEARGRESNRRGQRLLSRLSPLLLSAPSLALAARAPCPRALPRAILTTDARYCSERARAPSRGLRGVKGRSPRLLFALLTLSCECFVGTFGLLSLWGPGIGRARCSEEAGGGSCWCDKRWVDVRLVCLCVCGGARRVELRSSIRPVAVSPSAARHPAHASSFSSSSPTPDHVPCSRSHAASDTHCSNSVCGRSSACVSSGNTSMRVGGGGGD